MGEQLTDKIRDVAEDNQYVVFGEVDHHNVNGERLLFSEDMLQALHDGGVRNLMLEGTNDEVSVIINAYVDGEINQEQMESLIRDQVTATTGANNIEFVSEAESERGIVELAENAKTVGVHVYSLNRGEGLYPAENADARADLDTMTMERIIDAMKAAGTNDIADIDQAAIREQVEAENPELKALSDEIPALFDAANAAYLERAREFYDKNQDKLQPLMDENKVSEVQAISNIAMTFWIQDRIAEDHRVADRIENFADGEKTAVLYGAGHLAYRVGDLDHGLGERDTATIYLYENQDGTPAVLENLPPPKSRSIMDRILGRPIDEEPDYILDYGKGTWTDTDAGVTQDVDLPEFTATDDFQGVGFADDDAAFAGDAELGRDAAEALKEEGVPVNPDIVPDSEAVAPDVAPAEELRPGGP